MVKRYMRDRDQNLEEHPSGDLVFYSYYEQLEKALAEMTAIKNNRCNKVDELMAKLDAANKRVRELEKTVSLPEHSEILHWAFERDWRDNFEKLEKERDSLKHDLECKQIELDLSRNANAELKALIADWKIEEEAWKETEAKQTQSNDAMREIIESVIVLCKPPVTQTTVESIKLFVMAAIQKEDK